MAGFAGVPTEPSAAAATLRWATVASPLSSRESISETLAWLMLPGASGLVSTRTSTAVDGPK